jgi:hypothetical protein
MHKLVVASGLLHASRGPQDNGISVHGRAGPDVIFLATKLGDLPRTCACTSHHSRVFSGLCILRHLRLDHSKCPSALPFV